MSFSPMKKQFNKTASLFFYCALNHSIHVYTLKIYPANVNSISCKEDENTSGLSTRDFKMLIK